MPNALSVNRMVTYHRRNCDDAYVLTLRRNHWPAHANDELQSCTRHLFGKLCGDTGYLSQALAQETFQRFGVELITPRRASMKQVALYLADTVLFRKRAIVEPIIDQLKHLTH